VHALVDNTGASYIKDESVCSVVVHKLVGHVLGERVTTQASAHVYGRTCSKRAALSLKKLFVFDPPPHPFSVSLCIAPPPPGPVLGQERIQSVQGNSRGGNDAHVPCPAEGAAGVPRIYQWYACGLPCCVCVCVCVCVCKLTALVSVLQCAAVLSSSRHRTWGAWKRELGTLAYCTYFNHTYAQIRHTTPHTSSDHTTRTIPPSPI
jgi:hypothetical protein